MATEGILVLIGLFISIVIGSYFKSKGTERLNQLSVPFQNLLQNSSYQDIYDDGRRTYLVEGIYKARTVRCEIDTTHINQHQAVLSMQPRLIPKIIPGLNKVFAPPIIFKNIRLIQDWVKADVLVVDRKKVFETQDIQALLNDLTEACLLVEAGKYEVWNLK